MSTMQKTVCNSKRWNQFSHKGLSQNCFSRTCFKVAKFCCGYFYFRNMFSMFQTSNAMVPRRWMLILRYSRRRSTSFWKIKKSYFGCSIKKDRKAKCASHKKELEKFCRTCDKIICIGTYFLLCILIRLDCFIFDHRDHKIDNTDVVIEEKKMNLVQTLKDHWKRSY